MQPRYPKEYVEMARETGRPLYAFDVYDRFTEDRKGRRHSSIGVLSENMEPAVRLVGLAKDIIGEADAPRSRFAQIVAERRAAIREAGKEAFPYTDDEQRVVDYLIEITGGHVGAGTDPIGFLIASHRALGDRNRP